MKGKVKTILYITGLLVIIHVLLFCIKHFIFLFAERTYFSDDVAAICATVILTVLFILFAKKQKTPLSVFPCAFNKFYIIGTCAAAILFITAPSNYTGGGETICFSIYACVITPVFEELIFRRYIWNKLNGAFDKERMVYIITTALFGVWHLGYIDSVAFRVETDLSTVMMWMVVTGLVYGTILGALRLKVKNCYAAMLLHGVMNIFGR